METYHPAFDALAVRYRAWPALARLAAYFAGAVAASLTLAVLIWLVLRPGLDVLVTPARYPVAAGSYLAGTYLCWVGGALWLWRRGEGGSWAELGLPGSVGEASRFLTGLACGLGSIAALFGLEVAGGWMLWGAAAWEHTPATALAAAALTALFFGASEELIFRGLCYRILRTSWGGPLAVVATGALYAFLHFMRFDLGWVRFLPPFGGLWLAGTLLGWCAERTRGLAFPAGLHAGWVYGFFCSDRQHWFGYPAGSAWLTGGGFPLGGALTYVMLATLWGLLAFSWRQR